MIIPTHFRFKNAALFALGLCTPVYVIAASPHAAFNGVYGGVSGGWLRTDSRISASANSTYEDFLSPDNTLSSYQHHVHLYKDTFIGDAFIGYGRFLWDSDFYFAAEIFANWATRFNTLSNHGSSSILDIFDNDNNTPDHQTLSSTTTIKLRNGEYGIDLRPGFLVSPSTMLYGRVGAVFNKITNTTTNVFTYDNQPIGTRPYVFFSSAELSESTDHNVTGC